MAFRAFVAIPVQPTEGLLGLLAQLDGSSEALRLVEPANLHITLSFLGHVPEDAHVDLAEAIRTATRGVRAFEARLRSVGAFPNIHHPKVIWVGIEDPRPMVALAARVREELTRIGHPGDDKDFRAHLTLARVRPPSDPRGRAAAPGPRPQRLDTLVDFLRRHGQDVLDICPVDRVVLYKSLSGPRGPTYEPLATAGLEA